MSVQFELFEVVSNSNEIIFSAFVRDINAYRITKDITGRFKKKFLKIMAGEYSHSYIEKDTEESRTYSINEVDALENLRKYARDCALFSHTTSRLSPSNITHQFTLHFSGSDYNMNKGMEPKAAHKANEFFYELNKISQMRHPANNYLDHKPQEFTTAEAASLKLEMYSTVEMSSFKSVLIQLLNDIHNRSLSTESNLEYTYPMYKRLLKTFEGLEKFINLDQLKITVNNIDYSLTDFTSITALSSEIYGREISGEMIIQSVHDYYRDETYDGLIVDTPSFSQMTTWKYLKNEVISKILYKAKGESVRLTGSTSTETIRMLRSVEFLREDFDLTQEEKTALYENGLSIINKKIILN